MTMARRLKSVGLKTLKFVMPFTNRLDKPLNEQEI